jgi:hypothetical protein
MGESLCPFCRTAVPESVAPIAHGPLRQYVGKGATALALASALAATGCSDDTPTTPTATDSAVNDTATAADTTTSFDTNTPDTMTTSETAADAIDSDVQDTGSSTPLYK